MILTGFDILFFAGTGRGIGILLAGVFLALLLVQGLTLMVVFHYQAWFQNPVKKTLSNSLKIALGYLPYSAGLLLLFLVMGYGAYVSFPVMMMVFFFGMGVLSWVSAYLWRGVFDGGRK